jgi:hypothetical protein
LSSVSEESTLEASSFECELEVARPVDGAFRVVKVRIGKHSVCVRPNTFVSISARLPRLPCESGYVAAGAIGKRNDRAAATHPNCEAPIVVLVRTNFAVRSIDYLRRGDRRWGTDLNRWPASKQAFRSP